MEGILRRMEDVENTLEGSEEVVDNMYPDKISRLELLWVVRDILEYKKCGPLYYQPKGTNHFIEIVNDGVVMDMIKGLENGKIVDVYVDFISGVGNVKDVDGTQGTDVDNSRTSVESVANMVINRTFSVINKAELPFVYICSASNALNEVELPPIDLGSDEIELPVVYTSNDAGNEHVHLEGNCDLENRARTDIDKEEELVSSGYKSGSGSESATTEDELYGVELEDDEGSDKDEEVQQIKKSVSSYRRER
ncbi:uncharacterized protein [Euphorbia lathyris]|uniref:uncharacterized protein n=1 Tax=Euphorbia lathyris TaxID=212925 RepID=UPI003313C938